MIAARKPMKALTDDWGTKESRLLAEAEKHSLLHTDLEASGGSVDMLLMIVQRLENGFIVTLHQLIQHAVQRKTHNDHVATLSLLAWRWSTGQKGWQQVADRLIQWKVVRFSCAGRRDADIFDRLYDVFDSAQRQVLQRFCDQLDGLCFASDYVLPKLENNGQPR